MTREEYRKESAALDAQLSGASWMLAKYVTVSSVTCDEQRRLATELLALFDQRENLFKSFYAQVFVQESV